MLILFQIIVQSIKMAWAELSGNKLRSFLSLLGITIGIFCVITVFAVVGSLEHNIQESVNRLGSNVIYVQKWPWSFDDKDYAWWKYMNRPVPNMNELNRIKQNVKSAELAVIILELGQKEVKAGNNVLDNATSIGVSYEYDQLEALDFQDGRFFTSAESQGSAPEVVIGANIARGLFPTASSSVGKWITFQNHRLQVIGVMKPSGQRMMGDSFDDMVILPYSFLRNLVNTDAMNNESHLRVQLRDGYEINTLKDELRRELRSARKQKPKEEDNFALNELSVISNGLGSLFQVVDIAGLLIGLLSIVVGGFGIANIMFVSVRERTPMIGIKKALGAPASYILLEFLIESVVLCLFGGLFGLLLVFGIIEAGKYVLDFQLFLSFGNMLFGIGLSAGIGLVAGFIPALKASKMDPVVAIRFK